MGNTAFCSHEPRNERCVGGPLSANYCHRCRSGYNRSKYAQLSRLRPGPASSGSCEEASSRSPHTTGPGFVMDVVRVVRVEMDGALVVRSGPSEFDAAVGIIPSGGNGVQIIGDCRDLWCPIRHNGITGWVNRYFLAEESSPSADNQTR